MSARTQLEEVKQRCINNNKKKIPRGGKAGQDRTGHKAYIKQQWTTYGDKPTRNCKHKEIIKGANEEGNEGGKQVTRWVGSRQIDMRAHDTQKTRTEATCSHKTKTHAHGQQTYPQPCAKQDMNTQLMRKLISHVFTQDMTTWKHTDNEIHKLCATQHKI